ncbi:unnamed protein product [Darwinula stevensoni]|uniref:Urocanate hydratase n=1 Tax=Darwinula stevensoni TaxID=69355 RepID=A0A7R9FNH1_9CRUS|nr:unnamed protein product [Darwinula stevensoni]CAG0896373.1 unnamed protein product [Darwinula stevensoni]
MNRTRLDSLQLAVKNALRYFPPRLHATLAPEFASELQVYGHIYMYRFLPDFPIRAYPVDAYPAKTTSAACIMHMIMNNLDPRVAQFPQELVTYGGNGQVFSNWAQFWLVMRYLSELREDQTLVMYSGHPLGLFPATHHSPRMVITNGMVIPSHSSREDYDRLFALGVTMCGWWRFCRLYGQMTAGSYCYIGPQGIVHGTTITVLNAGRKYLGLEDLRGKVLVTSGLGGMSGAQAKAAVIAGCIALIAEVSEEALMKRYDQGWLKEYYRDVDEVISRVRKARRNHEVTSIGYLGNVVTLWERLAGLLEADGEMLVELGSDQTSCHNPFNGGYYPVQIGFQEAREMMGEEPEKFKALVEESLRRQVKAINKLSKAGMKFWDYGNAFLLEAGRAGASVHLPGASPDSLRFRYPSYVQDIMGDIFSMGFGPFRWVCTSGSPDDLRKTDQMAIRLLKDLSNEEMPEWVRSQYSDNIRWMEGAGEAALVVGSQARILYSDQKGRVALAALFNEAVAMDELEGPVVISRDHHDVSGTDSPYRETSNIEDGSAFCADMAVQNCIGDAFRGATWVALHNGGGVGWGEVTNGGFGLVLDGTPEASERAKAMLAWDVSNGVARRSWAGNPFAMDAVERTMAEDSQLKITMPHSVDEGILRSLFSTDR